MPHVPTKLLLLALLAATTFLVACEPLPYPDPGPGRTTLSSPAPSPGGKPAVPASGALTGAWVAPRGTWTQAQESALWTQREGDAGRGFDIAHSFYSFTKPFPTWRESWHLSQGRTPMVTWSGAVASEVTAGYHDNVIRERARALKGLGAPVYLRYGAEMDSKAKAAVAQNPEAFIAAWRHMHRIFQQEGAGNVAWVWCPTAWAFSIDNGAPWYPGNDVVDWVCADGYNWAPKRGSWVSFRTIFTNFYNWAVGTGKPIMVGEFGAMEALPGQKAAWIAEVAPTLRTHFPKIKAVVYFDSNKYEQGTNFDWRLDSTLASYQAWNTMVRDPYMNPRGR